MDCNLPASSVHGILQARILECVAISSFRASSQLRDWTCISCTGRKMNHWATREAQYALYTSQLQHFSSYCLLFLIYSLFLLKPMSIELVMPSNHLILCCPLHLLPSIFPSIRVFSNESALHIRWPKYWSFSFSISPSNEHPGLISFRMDWLDLRTVQGTLKSLLQHHSSKASVLRHSAFFLPLIKNLRSP